MEGAPEVPVDRTQRARAWGIQDPLENIDFSGVDLIGEFLEELALLNRSRASINNYRQILNNFQRFLDDERGGIHIGKATRTDVLLWKKKMDERGLSLTTIIGNLTRLSCFYKFLIENPEYPNSYNPVLKIRRSMILPGFRPTRREVSLEEMAKFVRSISHPRDRAMIVLMLKTGIRRGECAAIKLDHIAIDDNLEGKSPKVQPMSVFIRTGSEGVKRKIDTTIPIDEETARAVKIWLAVRPPTKEDALFVQLNTGKKLDKQSISYIVKKWTERFGWWSKGADLSVNVTPHYFRHFFTSQMRKRRMSDAMVSYLRGDSAKDIKDIYTHFTWEEIREEYDRCIYKFGI